nr:TIGR03745 family integrating conjugative element membrane protein [Pseudomonas syringae]
MPSTASRCWAYACARSASSSFLQTFQNYAFDGFTLLGLCLCAFGITLVGRHALGVYHEIHMGKAKWADLGSTAVVGVCLIGVTIFWASITKSTWARPNGPIWAAPQWSASA